MKSNIQRYDYIEDQRDRVLRIEQSSIMKQIHERNIKLFNIQLTSKKKILYEPRKLIKVNLSFGSYCYITDNQNIHANHTIFTIHGSPGDHRQWAGLQYQFSKLMKCRWINFIVPGYDGQDQRRGNYEGTADQLGKMLIQLWQQRKLGKIIICGHSMGSIISTYYLHKYPQWIQGYINITGIVDRWYCGMMTFYHLTIALQNLNDKIQQTHYLLQNNNDFRKSVRSKFLQDAKDIYFGDVKFVELTEFEICAYIKLFNSFPNYFTPLYELNRQLKLPRVLIFGRTDPLHQDAKVQQSLYRVCFGRQSYFYTEKVTKILKLMKNQIQNHFKQKYKININGLRIQQYFCYYFEQTGHNAHKRRPKQIATILQKYISFIEIYNAYEVISMTKI